MRARGRGEPGPSDVAQEWDRWWRQRIEANDAAKTPLQTLDDMVGAYRSAPPEQQPAIAAVVVAATGDDDPSVRWFALAFVGETGLLAALPTLRARAAGSTAAPARGPAAAELARVRSLVADLESRQGGTA